MCREYTAQLSPPACVCVWCVCVLIRIEAILILHTHTPVATAAAGDGVGNKEEVAQRVHVNGSKEDVGACCSPASVFVLLY